MEFPGFRIETLPSLTRPWAVAVIEVCSPVTVAGPRRNQTGFLPLRRLRSRNLHWLCSITARRQFTLPYPCQVTRGLTVFLVRHGESVWNVEGRLQGQTRHVPLTETGRQQVDRAAARLAASGAQLVLSSDLERALESARIIATGLAIPLRLERDLREQSLGIFEGRLAVDVQSETEPTNWTNPQWRPTGGESLQDVYVRLERVFQELQQEKPEGRVIVVTHGDTARVALALLRGRGPAGVGGAVLGNGEFIVHTLV